MKYTKLQLEILETVYGYHEELKHPRYPYKHVYDFLDFNEKYFVNQKPIIKTVTMAVLFPDYKQKPEVKIKTVDKVRRCHNRGLSLKETAQELGITSCTVRRYGFNWDGPRYPDFSPQQPLTNHYTEKENFFIKLSQQYIEEKELEERLDLERHGFA